MAETNVDVIVIGAGIAGLVTANRAAELGQRVVVLEKSPEDKYLCNSRYAYGTFHIHYTDVGADEDTLFGKIMACTEGAARQDLARAIAKDGRRLMAWFKSEGIDLIKLDNYQTNVLAPAWRKGFGLTWQNYGPDITLQRLGGNLEKRQGRILRGARATALKADGNGIVVETGRGAFRAKAVVVADGGFQANLDMVRANGISPAPERLLQRNGGTAIGDGIRLAQSLGAAITEQDMRNIYGHLHSREAMQSDRLWPRPYVDEVAASGIVVDGTGRRVADEGLGGVWLSNAIARLPDPLATMLIFDQPIWDGPGRNHVQPPNPLVQEAGGTVHQRRHARGSGRHGRGAGGCLAGHGRAIQLRARRRHVEHAHAAAQQRPPQAVADQDRAVLCAADLHRHHQLHGRHRGGRRRPRARQGRQTDPRPLRRRLHHRRPRWRPARRLRRRIDQGHAGAARRGDNRGHVRPL